MKILLLIFNILSVSLPGGAYSAWKTLHEEVVVQAGTDSPDNRRDYKQTDLLPFSTARLSTEESPVTSYVRSSNSGRRIQPSTKFPFRIIKAGKVVDSTNYYTFRISILQFQSGIFSANRYIYAICRLLI